MSAEEKVVVEKVVVTPAMILGMLADGKNRKAIGEELGLSGADVKRMFTHPELKNKKVKKVVEEGFVWAEEPKEEKPTATMETLVEAQDEEAGEEEVEAEGENVWGTEKA